MCIVCVEMAKGKLTQSEAVRALREVALDPAQKKHVQEVIQEMEKEEEKKARPQTRVLPLS